jgi:hypothetical protein
VSMLPMGPTPSVTYLDADNEMNWATIDGAESGVFMRGRLEYHPWFVPETRWLVFTSEGAAGWQISRQDLTTGVVEQLTSCPYGCVDGNLWYSAVAGDWLLAVIVFDAAGYPASYEVFQDLGAGFASIKTVALPDRGALKYVLSPEVFQVDGRAYAGFQLADNPGFGNPSEIFVAGLEPDDELVRRVSTETPMVRDDPEFYVTDEAVWMYYEENIDGTNRLLHRCRTGL